MPRCAKEPHEVVRVRRNPEAQNIAEKRAERVLAQGVGSNPVAPTILLSDFTNFKADGCPAEFGVAPECGDHPFLRPSQGHSNRDLPATGRYYYLRVAAEIFRPAHTPAAYGCGQLAQV
jgi:hypothetical protein